MRPAACIGLIGLIILAVAAVPTGATVVQPDIPTDSTAMDARVTPTGDAVWSVTYRIELSTADRQAAFDDLATDVAANESAYLDRFRNRITATVNAAENATGRPMRIQNLSVDTSTTGVSESYGLLTYRFRWIGFAQVDADRTRLSAGDALAGLYLDENTSLTIGWPDGYAATSVIPEPTATGSHSVTWRGPREFGAGNPRVVVKASSGGLPSWLVGAGLLVGLTAIVATVALLRRRSKAQSTDEDGVAATQNEDPSDDTPPSELLSNQEQVLKLLNEEGGRIKQQRIAERYEWSDAKTSQVIADLREDEEVETFRIGRENVVTLPDQEL